MEDSYSIGIILYSIRLLRWRSHVEHLDVHSLKTEMSKGRFRDMRRLSLHDSAYICKGLLDALRYGPLQPRGFSIMLRYLYKENILNQFTFTREQWKDIISIYPRSKVVLHVLNQDEMRLDEA